MVKDHAVSVVQPKNLICNFRAPNLQQFQRWKAYVQWAKDNGMGVYHLTLSLTDSFRKGIEGAAQVCNGQQVVNIQQNNVFQYQVSKPRRNRLVWIVLDQSFGEHSVVFFLKLMFLIKR
jgi:hypothetical protein